MHHSGVRGVELDPRIQPLLYPESLKRGLVIGKFMPVHRGHVALIRFAARHCDELIVSMSFTPTDPIDASLRFAWLREIFSDDPRILPARVEDNFDDESLPWPGRTKLWATFIRKTFPPIDIVFSSEEYGKPFADNLQAEAVLFDPFRKQFPVSASLIRNKPFHHWEFIPEVVRPYFVRKICFNGPESTGKSSMTIRMATKYNTGFVPEVAREMLITNDFTTADIVNIGKAHYERIQQKIKAANKLLMCDTDAITTQIYSAHYLHVVPPVLFELEAKVKYALYFLFDIDVPWVEDGLRDLGHRREEIFQVFKAELDKRGIDYILVTGSWHERERIVTEAIDRLLQ